MKISRIEKKAGIADQGFKSVDVRRLMATFGDFKDLSEKAEDEMKKWLDNGEFNISIDEAKERLSYYLGQMGLWEKTSKSNKTLTKK